MQFKLLELKSDLITNTYNIYIKGHSIHILILLELVFCEWRKNSIYCEVGLKLQRLDTQHIEILDSCELDT